MLKEMVPQLARVAIMYNPNSVPDAGSFFPSVHRVRDEVQRCGPSPRKCTIRPRSKMPSRNLAENLEAASVLVPDNFMSVHRDLIISLTAQFRIPAIYPYRYFAEAGGLVSYGVDAIDQFRRASEYVSRILRGAKPADLPVQAPTKFELVINLKTAKLSAS
jgi:ABC-type uncharacterized transport system, periplasmic component